MAETISTPAVKAMGNVRRGLRTSPAILPASHHPPKQKKALMAAPAMAPMSGSAPARRRGERGEIRHGGVTGYESPADQRGKHWNLEPVEHGHYAAGEPRPGVVEDAER